MLDKPKQLHSVAIGCFREAQLQGLLFGDGPWKAAGMSRPSAAAQAIELPAAKLTSQTSSLGQSGIWQFKCSFPGDGREAYGASAPQVPTYALKPGRSRLAGLRV